MKLKKEEIVELFCSAFDNAFYLFKTATETAFHIKNKKFPSLGLAELALEELGKSYACLAIRLFSILTRGLRRAKNQDSIGIDVP